MNGVKKILYLVVVFKVNNIKLFLEDIKWFLFDY